MSVEGRRRAEELFGCLCDTLLALAKMAQEAERYQVREREQPFFLLLPHSPPSFSSPLSLYPPPLFPSQVAEGALFTLHHLHNSRSSHNVPASLYPSLPWKHQLQEAKLHWDRGEANLRSEERRVG